MTKQDSWDSNFHFILLYNILEYLPSDSKSIKELLYHMMKYVKNKSIESNKTNNIPGLSDVDEVIIVRECGQTLGLGLVDKNRTVIIISLQWT